VLAKGGRHKQEEATSTVTWARIPMDVMEWAQAKVLEQELSAKPKEGAQDLRDVGRKVQYLLERTQSR
jgi:hypothetical protein